MAGKGDTFDNDWLKLIFQAVGIANIADNTATSALTSLYVALHTSDPTNAGAQNNNETTYTGYTRAAVARTSGGWTVSGATVNPAAAINFPVCTGGTATITYWSVGVASSGATKILYSGAVSPSISVSTGVIPQLTTASSIMEA